MIAVIMNTDLLLVLVLFGFSSSATQNSTSAGVSADKTSQLKIV